MQPTVFVPRFYVLVISSILRACLRACMLACLHACMLACLYTGNALALSLWNAVVQTPRLLRRDALQGTIEAQERDIDELKKSVYELSYMLSMQVFQTIHISPLFGVPVSYHPSRTIHHMGVLFCLFAVATPSKWALEGWGGEGGVRHVERVDGQLGTRGWCICIKRKNV